MAIKSLSIRIDEDMLDKLHVVADYEEKKEDKPEMPMGAPGMGGMGGMM